MKGRKVVFGTVAALLCAQSALATPAMQPVAIDPLVTVSALGTPQSRAAVAPVIASGAAQGVAPIAGPPPGWPANQYPRPNQYYRGAWVFLPGLIALLAILALHLFEDDGPDFTPVSP